MVNSFTEFCEKLIENGFSMGGGNPKGIYGIVSFDWKNPIPSCPIVWHTGDPYGWNSTVFTTVEDFGGEDIALDIPVAEAYEKIRERILLLNPEAKEKDIKKFIGGKKTIEKPSDLG